MVLSVWLLTTVLPSPRMIGTNADRLGYALRANVVALLPLFIMIITIANSRFLSEAIDPTRHAESPTMLVDGRVAENTLQQNFGFAVASLAMSTLVSPGNLQVVWACTIVFVVARCALDGISRQSLVSRAGHVGHRVPKPRDDRVRPLPADGLN